MIDRSITRWIRGYEKDGDRLEVEFRLPTSVSLEELQNIFRVETDNPMYDCYPIEDNQARVLETYLGQALDLTECDFFLEAESETM